MDELGQQGSEEIQRQKTYVEGSIQLEKQSLQKTNPFLDLTHTSNLGLRAHTSIPLTDGLYPNMRENKETLGMMDDDVKVEFNSNQTISQIKRNKTYSIIHDLIEEDCLSSLKSSNSGREIISSKEVFYSSIRIRKPVLHVAKGPNENLAIGVHPHDIAKVQDKGNQSEHRKSSEDHKVEKPRFSLHLEEVAKKRRSTGTKEKDTLITAMGDIGLWQIVTTLVLTFFNIPSICQVVAPNFQTREVEFWCAPPPSLSDISKDKWIQLSGTKKVVEGKPQDDPCFIKNYNYSESYNKLVNQIVPTDKIPCQKWQYNVDSNEVTVTSQFSLGCGAAANPRHSETLFAVGGILSGLTSGILSDRFGRKMVIVFMQIGLLVTGTLIVSAPTFIFFLCYRCLLGYFCTAYTYSAAILIAELTGGVWISTCESIFMLSYPLAYIYTTLLYTLDPNWITVQHGITLISLSFFAFSWLLPESPRWLLIRHEKYELLHFLQVLQSINKKVIPSDQKENLTRGNVMTSKIHHPSIIDLFRTHTMREISFKQPILWFLANVNYYGLVFHVANILMTPIRNGIAAACFELASVVILLLFHRKETKHLAMISCGLGGICTLLTTIVTSARYNRYVAMVVAMTGRLMLTITQGVLTNVLFELYPTVIRNTGISLAVIAASGGIFFSPIIRMLGKYHESLPTVVYGTAGILAGFQSSVLPEKRVRDLPDLIEEVEATWKKEEERRIQHRTHYKQSK